MDPIKPLDLGKGLENRKSKGAMRFRREGEKSRINGEGRGKGRALGIIYRKNSREWVRARRQNQARFPVNCFFLSRENWLRV